MPDNQYLSIGEVLGLLLEDFPDVTISKIRFLESQGLIEPERTPSGYRKFYEHDVERLRTILHEQKANFLPLKVIRDRIESGAIDSESVPRTPPRGIRNVDVADPPPTSNDTRDSVFRRTDGGPEWAEGRPFIPGDDPVSPPPPITTAVPVTPASPVSSVPSVPSSPPSAGSATAASAEPPAARAEPEVPPSSPAVTRAPAAERTSSAAPENVAASPAPDASSDASSDASPAASPSSTHPSASSPRPAPAKVAAAVKAPAENKASARPPAAPPIRADATSMPYSRDELCSAAGISELQLVQLEEFGLVIPRGSGSEVSYPADALEIARVAGQFLEQGIDARHLRAWRQAAERESALFEQRIMPLLRQRNPQSRQQALDSLSELAELGSELRAALVGSLLRHHFEGG